MPTSSYVRAMHACLLSLNVDLADHWLISKIIKTTPFIYLWHANKFIRTIEITNHMILSMTRNVYYIKNDERCKNHNVHDVRFEISEEKNNPTIVEQSSTKDDITE